MWKQTISTGTQGSAAGGSGARSLESNVSLKTFSFATVSLFEFFRDTESRLSTVDSREYRTIQNGQVILHEAFRGVPCPRRWTLSLGETGPSGKWSSLRGPQHAVGNATHDFCALIEDELARQPVSTGVQVSLKKLYQLALLFKRSQFVR